MSKQSAVFAVLIAAAAMVACGDSPIRPSGQLSLRIEGPSAIAPGSSAQLRLIVTPPNGASSDVTTQSAWTSGNRSVLSFSGTGVASGHARGEAQITAAYQGQNTQAIVFVLENGTFRLNGRVIEAGIGLAGAKVQVVRGTGTGLSATTTANGSYAIYGVAGEVEVEVTLEGFEPQRRPLAVNGHIRADLDVTPTTPPTDVSGDWRLTLNTAPQCAPIAQDVATRSYLVTITQTSTTLQFQVKSPPIPPGVSWLSITGRVIDRTVTLTLPVDDFYYYFYGTKFYALIEPLAPARILAIAGIGRGDRQGDVVAGKFDGEFAVYRNENNGAVWNRDFGCNASDHTFRMDR